MGFDINGRFSLNEEDQQDLPPVPLRPDFMPGQQVASLDPTVKDYLMKKNGMSAPAAAPMPEAPMEAPVEMPLIAPQAASPAPSAMDQFSDENYKKARAEADDESSNLGWSQFAAGMGEALAGRDISGSTKNFADMRKGIQDRTIGDFDKRKKNAMDDVNFKNNQTEFANKQAGRDPNSKESQAFRKMMEAQFPDVAKTYGDSWANVTASDSDNIFKPLQLRETIKSREQQARILAADRNENRAARKDAADLVKEEKMQGLQTPYGLANTVDDAKQLKEGHESKKNFDSKIQEMIDLRKKYGAETYNREAVGRGKQLSKDLLLEYKNMAKLGVLSKSDEDIINAIIPEDPLAFQTASLVGQDPILHKLEKFKGDSDKDFKNRIATRTRAGVKTAAQDPAQESDVANYAKNHNISFDEAMTIKMQRTTKQAGR